MNESTIRVSIQLAASAWGCRLFRNNVGVFYTRTGELTRCGLCEGSSDLIGWTKDGRFLAIEVKHGNGKPTPEQEHFIASVRKAGGVAGIAYSVSDFTKILLGEK
jgi:hypothetical protein